MRVLILRPEPGTTATAQRVAAMGHVAVPCPLFDIVPLAWNPPDPARFDAVVMTSANAARHGGAALARYAHLPLYAVGEATATAARAVGFADVIVGKGDARDLAGALALLPASGTGGSILHLTGEDHIPLDLPDTVAIPVYAARPTDVAVLPDADVALVHSPRAGQRLAELTRSRALAIVAISPAAAAACGTGWRTLQVARAPREAAMLACLAQLCEAAPR